MAEARWRITGDTGSDRRRHAWNVRAIRPYRYDATLQSRCADCRPFPCMLHEAPYYLHVAIHGRVRMHALGGLGGQCSNDLGGIHER